MSRHSSAKIIFSVVVHTWFGLLLPALVPSQILGQPSRLLFGTQSSTASIPSSWQDDADLHDVFFLDANLGWAVGDLGVIWHSVNGGAIWQRQSTPVDCRLASVHFIDPRNGWAVGGYSYPLTHRSTGIVLRSKDGGRTWEEITGLLVPWLTSVRFLTERRGLAAGMASALHPSGVFSTENGGRTWSPLQGVSGSHWAHASFQKSTGLLVSRSGRTAWLKGTRVTDVETGSGRNLSNQAYAALLNARIGFVGHGGRPRLSVDGGNAWQPVGPLPDGTASSFRFATFVALGSHCWLAGNPGTRVFRSQDHARSWQSLATGNNLPMHKLQFTDVDRGWAVGPRGLILATDDGGETWKTQRGGGKRAALLGIFADEQDVAWELLTKASAGDQYRVHVVLLSRSAAADDPLRCPPESRLAEATMRIGASGEILTRLPLPAGALRISSSDLIRRWERSDSNVMQRLTAQMTNLIRTWRPEVVLTSLPQPTEESPHGLQQITSRLVADACELAASDVAFPEQIRQAGLQPWKTARVVAVSNQTGTAADAPRVRDVMARGRRVIDLARRSQQLMQTEMIRDARSWTLVSLGSQNLGDAGSTLGRHPFGGLFLRFGASARRPRDETNHEFAVRRRVVQRQSHVRNVLLRGDSLIGSEAKFVEQADRLLATIEPAAAGDILFELAEHAASDGKFERAAEIYLRLITRYEDHALTDHAMQWLMAYHTSAEIQWRRQRMNSDSGPQLSRSRSRETLGTHANTQTLTDQPAVGALATTTIRRTPNREVLSDAPIRLASAVLPAAPINPGTPNAARVGISSESAPQREKAPWQAGFNLARKLKSQRPDLYVQPEIIFPLAAITRARDESLRARALYRRQLGLPASTRWRQRAAAELAMLDPTSSRDALSVWPCVYVNDKPYLDGDLSDVCWQQARPQLLVHPSGSHDSQTGEEPNAETELVTSVYVVHDDTYLYFAAACEKHPQVTYLPLRRPRPRDANLEGSDRIELLLDINRDYASSWRMVFDHRGWTAESVLGDSKWNPTYYVASAANDLQWTIEIAIPLQELAPASQFQAGTEWGIGVRRLIPGLAMQSWKPLDRVTNVHETNGVMLIE